MRLSRWAALISKWQILYVTLNFRVATGYYFTVDYTNQIIMTIDEPGV